MKRKSKGIGARADCDQKRDGSRKKKAPSVKSNWGPKKAKVKETADRSARRHRRSYDVRQIKIADIKVVGKRRALNPEKLNHLMQSIPILGLRQLITVRPVKRRHDWKDTKPEYALVSGLHRLEAEKRLGETAIPCFVMEGDKREARKWEISENLHRAELTPLEYDAQVAEWVRLTESDPPISGQNVQKKGRGRRKGGISEAARRLPIKGKTHTAKRKNVERALKVDSIFPEAKDAAKKAGFDKNRSKLLKVAAEKTLEAQLANYANSRRTNLKREKNGVHSGQNRRPLTLIRKLRSPLKTKGRSNTCSKLGMTRRLKSASNSLPRFVGTSRSRTLRTLGRRRNPASPTQPRPKCPLKSRTQWALESGIRASSSFATFPGHVFAF